MIYQNKIKMEFINKSTKNDPRTSHRRSFRPCFATHHSGAETATGFDRPDLGQLGAEGDVAPSIVLADFVAAKITQKNRNTLGFTTIYPGSPIKNWDLKEILPLKMENSSQNI